MVVLVIRSDHCVHESIALGRNLRKVGVRPVERALEEIFPNASSSARRVWRPSALLSDV